MNTRLRGIPVAVFTEAQTGVSRCVNGLHVQTFVPNRFGKGTHITFINGDYVTVEDSFDAVVDAFMCDKLDG